MFVGVRTRLDDIVARSVCARPSVRKCKMAVLWLLFWGWKRTERRSKPGIAWQEWFCFRFALDNCKRSSVAIRSRILGGAMPANELGMFYVCRFYVWDKAFRWSVFPTFCLESFVPLTKERKASCMLVVATEKEKKKHDSVATIHCS